jgi:hypothetical protein
MRSWDHWRGFTTVAVFDVDSETTTVCLLTWSVPYCQAYLPLLQIMALISGWLGDETKSFVKPEKSATDNSAQPICVETMHIFRHQKLSIISFTKQIVS